MASSLLVRMLAAGVAAAAFALAGAHSGEAFDAPGRPWPSGTVPYYNAALDQEWAVYQAVKAWNTSGARVRFVPTTPEHARLVIRSYPVGRCLAHAQATVGYVPGATVYVSRADLRDPMCTPYTTAGALAHELGHVLGLAHEHRRCAAMNPAGNYRGTNRCPQTAPWEWRCRLLEGDDVAGAVALYGGVVRKVRTPAACPIYSPIEAPGSLEVELDEVADVVHVSFGRPVSPRIPAFVVAAGRGRETYALSRARTACPTKPDLRGGAYTWTSRAGELEQLVDDAPASGRYCYAAWALDEVGRPSIRAATAWLVVP